MNKNFWSGAMLVAVMSCYMGLRLLWQGICYVWRELGELTDEPIIHKMIVVIGIVATCITAYGHFFVEPHGFMTTQWQFWVALLSVGFGFTTVLMLAIVIGGGLSRLIATYQYGPSIFGGLAGISMGVMIFLDPQESIATYGWIAVTVGLPGFLALGAIGHQLDWWYKGDDEEELDEEGEPTA
jgi:hypothetical protein